MKSLCYLWVFAVVVVVVGGATSGATQNDPTKPPEGDCEDEDVCELLVGDALCKLKNAGVRNKVVLIVYVKCSVIAKNKLYDW